MDDKFVENTCRLGCGKECCRYLGMGMKGWKCLKLTNLKSIIDEKVNSKAMSAEGDNCEGIKDNN